MYRNYFVLNRLALELRPLVANSKLLSAFSQEKDRLILTLEKNDEEFFLEVSLNPGNPFIMFRDSFSRAKQNSVGFFENILPVNLINLDIADDDRIIRFRADNISFYFAIRGKYTNFYYVSDSNEAGAFEKMAEDSADSILKDIKSKNFVTGFNLPSFDSYRNIDETRTAYPIIGKEIAAEYKSRHGSENDSAFPQKLDTLLHEIKDGSFLVLVDSRSGEVHLSPASFSLYPAPERYNFSSLIEALGFFLKKKFSVESSFTAKKIIIKHLEREISKLSRRLDDVLIRIEKGSKEEEYSNMANLLLINLTSIRQGDTFIEVENLYDNNKQLRIKLDPKFSPRKNADILFDKAKNERISYSRAVTAHTELLNEFTRLKSYMDKVVNSDNPEDFKNIAKELKIKMNDNQSSSKEDLKSKFKQYLIEQKYMVYVGKDSKNNDLLTTKFAKQNDYWFHARSVSGSHVVLRIDNTKEPVPKSVLKKTASLAAYHSKAKSAGMVPVSFTFKKYVVKKKGMEAGKVALLKEDVLIVKPEIPEGAVYVTNE